MTIIIMILSETKYCVFTHLQEKAALDSLLGDLLDGCYISEVIRVTTCFGHVNGDLDVVTVGHSRPVSDSICHGLGVEKVEIKNGVIHATGNCWKGMCDEPVSRPV